MIRGRIRVQIAHRPDGVRVYGNRAFFEHLKAEVDRIVACPSGGHCEFQTLSLNGVRPGFEGVPEVSIARLASPDKPLAEAESIDRDDYDLILMIVDDKEP